MSLLLSQPKVEISGPVTAVAAFDPPAVHPGEQSIYRVTFNALEQSIELPAEIKSQPKLQIQPGAHGQMLQNLGPKQAPITSFNYRVRAAEVGEFTIPQFVANVYGNPVTVPAARLQVVPAAEPVPPPQRLLLEMASTNLFVGQPARVRVRFPGSSFGGIQVPAQVQLTGQGFIVDQGIVQQSILPVPGQPNAVSFNYETIITPISSGKITLFAQAFTGGNRFSGPVVISGNATVAPGSPQYALLESDAIDLEVSPLPRKGELPGFTGAIGGFTLDPPKLSTNTMRVGDTIKLTITVRTNGVGGQLSRLVPPPAPLVRDWQVMAGTAAAMPPQMIQVQGFATFQYILIPLSEKTQATPPIPFSFFDPVAGAYSDLTIPAVAVTVNPGAVSADLQALLQPSASDAGVEERLELSGLAASAGRTARRLAPWEQQAWFPVVQFAPVIVFLGLWGWDRRRRYLEQHPDLVRRRRARRALHRQRRAVRRAARVGDAPRFAAAAVSAMQVACAPHFPAEPRALVGSDVLQMFGETTGDGQPNGERELVRRFFMVTDVSRFATSPADATDLLAFQPELERVLEQLEAKL